MNPRATAAQAALESQYAAFGETLKRVRRARAYNQGEANRRADLHHDSFYLVERGKVRPRMMKLCRLAWSLQVSAAALASTFALPRDCSIERVLATSPTHIDAAEEGAARLGATARYLRGQRRQRQIATTIGIRANYVGALERGDIPSPTLGTVFLLASGLTPADPRTTLVALVTAYAGEGVGDEPPWHRGAK